MHSISIAAEIHRPSFFACVRMQVLRKQANLSAIRFPFPVNLAGRDVLSHLRIVFRLGASEDFLKSQVVSKRVPFQRERDHKR